MSSSYRCLCLAVFLFLTLVSVLVLVIFVFLMFFLFFLITHVDYLETRLKNDLLYVQWDHLLLQPFYDPLSGTTQVSRYQKYEPFWILLKQTRWVRGSGIS